MFNYSKSITLSKEELKALRGAIEAAIHNAMLDGCPQDRFEALKNLEKRLIKAKQ